MWLSCLKHTTLYIAQILPVFIKKSGVLGWYHLDEREGFSSDQVGGILLWQPNNLRNSLQHVVTRALAWLSGTECLLQESVSAHMEVLENCIVRILHSRDDMPRIHFHQSSIHRSRITKKWLQSPPWDITPRLVIRIPWF